MFPFLLLCFAGFSPFLPFFWMDLPLFTVLVQRYALCIAVEKECLTLCRCHSPHCCRKPVLLRVRMPLNLLILCVQGSSARWSQGCLNLLLCGQCKALCEQSGGVHILLLLELRHALAELAKIRIASV